ncbi:failed axon connections homolog [Argonauta hians]
MLPQWAVITAGVGGIIAVVIVVLTFLRCRSQREYPENTIILHLIPRIKEAPNISPFAIKLETYLRMAKLPYQVEYTAKLSPKNKSPWITYNGEVVSDSQFIIEYLNKKFNIDLNSNLTAEQQGIARAMQKMVEENLFWALALIRFVYCYSDPSLQKLIPVPKIVIWNVKRIILKQSYCQGLGRHSQSEVEKIAMEDLKALSHFIGEKKFLMGEEPCETDCAIFGIIAVTRQMPESSICTKMIEDGIYPNLTKYFDRLKDLYWPDWKAPNLKVPSFGLQPQTSTSQTEGILKSSSI